MNKFFCLFLISVSLVGCSLDTKTGLWSKSEKVEKEKEAKEIFKKENASTTEFNPSLKILLPAKFTRNNLLNKLTNNTGRAKYNGNLENILKFKFSSIDNFNEIESDIIFHNKDIIFFDNKGQILKFDNNSKIIWKKNYYTKIEKKLKPKLFFSNNKNVLIVVDSIAKYYAIDINNGNLLWSKSNSAPYNSEVKVYKDYFFAIDSENVIRCYSIKTGKEIWTLKTDKSFINSQKRLSIVIQNNNVYFNNSVGDIGAIDINSGNLIWQTPTQSSSIYEEAFFLQTSDLIIDRNSILFSNNKNQFFSIDTKSGTINWKQKINSNVRPTVFEDVIFTATIEGYLTILDYKTGNIIRVTDIFNQFGKNKRKKIKPVGFILGSSDIYLTTSNGKLLVIDIKSGKTIFVLKIDNEMISRPFTLSQKLYIIKNNSIVQLD